MASSFCLRRLAQNFPFEISMCISTPQARTKWASSFARFWTSTLPARSARFPPARWGSLAFIRAGLLAFTSCPPPPHQLQTPDLSRHCRTSTASSRSQRALPDLNSGPQSSVGSAGPQPRAPNVSGPPTKFPDVSGHCQTSTASARCHWSLPDINGEHKMSDRMPQRVPWMCQVECQNMHQMECQIECQNIHIYVCLYIR